MDFAGCPRGIWGSLLFLSRQAVGHSGRETWCPPTKEQGLAGRGAPRPTRLGSQLSGGRGARRRRNKGLRGGRHHVRLASGPLGSGDVVLVDEGTRASEEGGTTSDPPSAHRSPNRAEESKLSRPLYRKIILTQLAIIFNPEKPNNKFKIPLFSTHSCRMKTNVY